MIKPHIVCEFPITPSSIATALEVNLSDTWMILEDGRFLSYVFLLKLGSLAGHSIAPDGVSGRLIRRGTDNTLWKYKVATSRIDFSPSQNRGMGRAFDEQATLKKHSQISGYYLAFNSDFWSGKVPVYEVSHEIIRQWRAEAFLDREYSGEADSIKHFCKHGAGEQGTFF